MSQRDFASGICDLANSRLRSLMRHRERYVKAWMAHYGVESFDGVEMVETHFPEGTTITFCRPIMSEADALREQNDRLRALIKQAEMAPTMQIEGCPWCAGSGNASDPPRHTDDCPAFTLDGEVR